MEIIDCDIFQKWSSFSQDYFFKGGRKPLNIFPSFFTFYVYKNANCVNTPDNIIDKEHEFKFSSLGLFELKCSWDDFLYETTANFNTQKNVVYFARDSDYLEIKQNEAFYEIALNMKNHIGKVVFQMPNIESGEEDVILPIRIFLPKLKLTHIDSTYQFQIIYSQNKRGMGIEDSDTYITNDLGESFYFDKPFLVHVYIDNINLLSIYIHNIG